MVFGCDMRLIKYKDSCVIVRNKRGEYDEYDNPVQEMIYEGVCNYQEDGVTATGIIIRKPTIYLPTNDVLVHINDIVNITTETGREIVSVVENVRDIRFRGMNDEITKIELKQGVGAVVDEIVEEIPSEREGDSGNGGVVEDGGDGGVVEGGTDVTDGNGGIEEVVGDGLHGA